MKITHEKQTNITRAIINVAISMLEYGAESFVVERSAIRLGKALGINSVEVSMISSAIVLSTLHNDHCITTTRRVHRKGINMAVVNYIQKIVLEVESKKLDEKFIAYALDKANPIRYNRWLVIFMVGLSCMAFAHLQGGDIYTHGIVFLAAATGMYTKQEIDKRKFLPTISFGVTAFFVTIVASLALLFSKTPNIALAASVLFLFPGFPFVSSLLDSLKGYLSMGWGRWLFASLMTLSVAIGILLASAFLNIGAW